MSELHPAVLADLERQGIAYEVMDCDPELADTAAFCAHYGIAPEDSANTIIVVGKSTTHATYVACVVLATTRLDVNRAVRQKIGIRKCSFASADETRELTGMLIGGVTAFGLPEGMPLWVDSRVMERPLVVLGGGNRSTKLKITPAELAKAANIEVVEGLANAIEG